MKKTVLIVGAAGGVGMALARRLAENGHDPVCTVLDAREEAMLRQAVPALGPIVHVDLRDSAAAKATIRDHLDRTGVTLDAAVNCAAIALFGAVELGSVEDFRAILEINTVANLAIYQAVVDALKVTKGRMIFVSSYAGKVGGPLLGFYTSSKHALEGLADVMRFEAAMFGVDVVMVEPGSIKTPMTSGIFASAESRIAALGDAHKATYGALYEQWFRLGRAGYEGSLAPDAVADTVVEAIEDAVPATRYVVGADAVDLIEKRRTLSDRELDAFFRQMMQGAVDA